MNRAKPRLLMVQALSNPGALREPPQRLRQRPHAGRHRGRHRGPRQGPHPC